MAAVDDRGRTLAPTVPEPADPPAPVPLASGRRRAVLVAVFSTVALANLDLFVVNVALPQIGRGFPGAGISLLSWVLNAYAIVFAAMLVPAGRWADRLGHRGGFLAGLSVFAVGSALCAAAPGAGWLIAARAIQAVGAAALLPASLALLLATARPGQAGRVVRTWSAVGGVCAALGPVVGGLLVQADWRWVFLINLPVSAGALVLGARVLPRGRRQVEHRPDLIGALLLTAAVAALTLGIAQGGSWGWTSPRVLTALASTPALLALIALRGARHPAQIIEPEMLRVRAFSTATVATLLFAVSFAGMILTASLWCQDGWGYSALRTGLALAPGPLMVPPMAAAAGPLGRRIGPGPVAALGNLLFGGGLLYIGLVSGSTPNYATELLPGLLIGGVGVGLALPTLTAVAATALPFERLATGTGVLTMARQVGAALGVAVTVVLLGTSHSAATARIGFQHSWYCLAAFAAAAAVASLAIRRRA